MDTGVKKYNISLSSSPSYLFNNLSSSSKYYSYVTNSEPAPRCFIISSAILEKGETSSNISKASYKDLVEIQNSTLFDLKIDGIIHTYLALSTLDKLILFNNNGSRMLAHFPQQTGIKLPEETDNLIYWTSVTPVASPSVPDKEFLVASNSVGSLFGAYPKGPETFEREKLFSFADQTAVVAMACDKTKGIVGAGNATGFIIFLQIAAPKKLEPIGSLQLNKDSVPITSVGVLYRGANLFVAGDANGLVSVIECSSEKPRVLCTIQAHQQALTALICHPTKSVFATAGEDSMVTVWEVNEDEKLNLVFDYQLANKIPTGVAFVGENSSSLLIAQQDHINLAYFKDLVWL